MRPRLCRHRRRKTNAALILAALALPRHEPSHGV
jgi:hypothetical protein